MHRRLCCTDFLSIKLCPDFVCNFTFFFTFISLRLEQYVILLAFASVFAGKALCCGTTL